MEQKTMPEALKKVWEFIKKNKYVMVVILLGAMLISLPKGEKEQVQETSVVQPEMFSLAEEEKRISSALSEMDGVGKVTVVLTVRSTGETVVAKDTETYIMQEDGQSRQEVSSSVVIVSEGNQKERPVSVELIYPEYQGALIVAQGAENAEIKLRLTQAVADLTGLSTEKITVVKMKSS